MRGQLDKKGGSRVAKRLFRKEQWATTQHFGKGPRESLVKVQRGTGKDKKSKHGVKKVTGGEVKHEGYEVHGYENSKEMG